jgi:hypothetical protein
MLLVEESQKSAIKCHGATIHHKLAVAVFKYPPPQSTMVLP